MNNTQNIPQPLITPSCPAEVGRRQELSERGSFPTTAVEHPSASSEGLRLFTQPQILRQINPRRINLFLCRFADDLAAAGITVPDHEALNGEYYSAIEGLLAGPLPDRLRTTMIAIETAAAPENTSQLERLIKEHIPNVAINPAFPLDCALEVWFHAPAGLDQSVPVVTPISRPPSTDALPSGLNPDPNQKSKIEIPKSLSLTDSPPGPLNRAASSLTNSLAHKLATAVEPWPDPVDGKALLDELTQNFTRFVILPRWAAETLALWTLHTYAFQLRDICTYIAIESPLKRCGKTTLLELLGELAYRAVSSANISPPAFFRVIQEFSPSLLIDEADTFLPGNDQLKGILNSGYKKKNSFVLRASSSGPLADAEQNADNSGISMFSSWCPKAIATIGHLPDTLADRCIIIRMQRKTNQEECDRLRNLVAEPLRRKCKRFVMDHEPEIAAAQPELPEELNDRATDIWEPLFALADLAGGDWPQKARQAAIGLSASAQESNPISSLLLDIFILFMVTKETRLFTRTILNYLNARLSDRPWGEGRNGKPIHDQWLANQLRPYGIRSRTIWIGDEHAKGYLEEDFQDTCRRYVARADYEALKAEWAAQRRPENKQGQGEESSKDQAQSSSETPSSK